MHFTGDQPGPEDEGPRIAALFDPAYAREEKR